MDLKVLESEKISDPIECPFCGAKTVLAKIMTQLVFISEHPLYTDGVNMDGETMGQIIGEPSHEPFLKYTGFRCTSCGKSWYTHQYKLVKDENGILSFEEQKNVKRKGRKAND